MADHIDAHLAHCRAAALSPLTIQDRGKLLRRMDAELPYGLNHATTEEITDWLTRDPATGDQRTWKGFTRPTYHSHITAYFGWATDRGFLDYDPSAALPRPRQPRSVPRPVTDEELAAILGRIPEPYRTWAELAAYEGLRCCEIAGLRREEITQEEMTVHGKGNKTRVVPTHPRVWHSVRDLPPGPIARRFTDGQPADARYVSKVLRHQFHLKARVAAGPHRLRHWFGTNTYRASKNIRVVQELLGHQSVQTTMGYTLVTSEERRQAVTALPTVAVPS